MEDSLPAFSFSLLFPFLRLCSRDLQGPRPQIGKSPYSVTETHSHQKSQSLKLDKEGGVQLGEIKGSECWEEKMLPSWTRAQEEESGHVEDRLRRLYTFIPWALLPHLQLEELR